VIVVVVIDVWCSTGVAAAGSATITVSPKAWSSGSSSTMRRTRHAPDCAPFSEAQVRGRDHDGVRPSSAERQSCRTNRETAHSRGIREPTRTVPPEASASSGKRLPTATGTGSRSASPPNSKIDFGAAIGIPARTAIGTRKVMAPLAAAAPVAALGPRYNPERATLRPANLGASLTWGLPAGSGWLGVLGTLLPTILAIACVGTPAWLRRARRRPNTPELLTRD